MPAPKAEELHVLEGTYRADRHGNPSVQATADGEPARPRHLKGAARKLWEEVVPELIRTGLAHARDCAELTTMCEWWGRYRDLSTKLDRLPVDDEGYGPLFNKALAASQQFDRAAARFGMSPADRTRLRIPQREYDRMKVASRKRG